MRVRSTKWVRRIPCIGRKETRSGVVPHACACISPAEGRFVELSSEYHLKESIHMFERVRISVRKGLHSIRLGMFRNASALVLGLMCSQTATATVESAVGTISNYRLYTLSFWTVSARDVSAFQLSPAMGNGCVWVWVDATDKNTLAVVLAAKTTGATVSINFDNAVPSPWGDTSMCALDLISLN